MALMLSSGVASLSNRWSSAKNLDNDSIMENIKDWHAKFAASCMETETYRRRALSLALLSIRVYEVTDQQRIREYHKAWTDYPPIPFPQGGLRVFRALSEWRENKHDGHEYKSYMLNIFTFAPGTGSWMRRCPGGVADSPPTCPAVLPGESYVLTEQEYRGAIDASREYPFLRSFGSVTGQPIVIATGGTASETKDVSTAPLPIELKPGIWQLPSFESVKSSEPRQAGLPKWRTRVLRLCPFFIVGRKEFDEAVLTPSQGGQAKLGEVRIDIAKLKPLYGSYQGTSDWGEVHAAWTGKMFRTTYFTSTTPGYVLCSFQAAEIELRNPATGKALFKETLDFQGGSQSTTKDLVMSGTRIEFRIEAVVAEQFRKGSYISVVGELTVVRDSAPKVVEIQFERREK